MAVCPIYKLALVRNRCCRYADEVIEHYYYDCKDEDRPAIRCYEFKGGLLL